MNRRPALSTADQRIRHLAAEMAARQMRDSHLTWHEARRKAALQLGLHSQDSNPQLPSRQEIEHALVIQLRLFASPDHAKTLRCKREAAARAMPFFHVFSPRLCGRVLDGTAQAHDPIVLHLHTDTPEEVIVFLEEHHLPAQLRSAHFQLSDGNCTLPCWTLLADGQPFELCVLPLQALQNAPRDPIDHSKLPRASLAQLQKLLDD